MKLLSQMKVLLALFVLALIPLASANAATSISHVARVPNIPNSDIGVRVWLNADTAFGESACIQTNNSGTYTEICGTYDTSTSGANWRVDIPAYPGGTDISYQLFVRNEFGNNYLWGGFNQSYKVQTDNNADEIDYWCGGQLLTTCAQTIAPSTSTLKPNWTQDASGNDTYTFKVDYKNYGDTLCIEYSSTAPASIPTTRAACSGPVSDQYWTCTMPLTVNFASSTMTYRFYNDNNDGATTADCTNTTIRTQVSATGSFPTSPTAVSLEGVQVASDYTTVYAVVAGVGLLMLSGLGVYWVRRHDA